MILYYSGYDRRQREEGETRESIAVHIELFHVILIYLYSVDFI